MIDKPTLQEQALKIATEIHEQHKNSYWAQAYLVQELKAELERLDKEYNESRGI